MLTLEQQNAMLRSIMQQMTLYYFQQSQSMMQILKSAPEYEIMRSLSIAK